MKLKRYSSPGGAKYPFLGEIPSHWTSIPLKHLIQAGRPITYGIVQCGPDVAPEGIPYIRPADMSDEAGVTPNHLQHTSSEIAAPYSRSTICAGDLVISIGPSFGKVMVVPKELDGANLTQGTARVAVDTSVADPKFVFWALRSNHSSSYWTASSTGATFAALTLENLANTPMAIPRLQEQSFLASLLDREIAKIDALIAERRRILDLLNSKIVSLASTALTNKSYEWCRLEFLSRATLRPVQQQGGEVYTPLGLFNRGRGLFHKEPRPTEEMGDSDFFWIKPGDLILSGQFAWEGAVAFAGPEEDGCVVSHRYPILRGNGVDILTEYLYALLLTDFGEFLLNENSRGAAGRNRPLNIRSLLKEKIPIAPMPLQEEIRDAIYARKPIVDEAGRLLMLLQEHRTALITAVVTGKVDVRDAVKEIV